jgi:hypothetical protein
VQEILAVSGFCLAFFTFGYWLGRLRGHLPLWFELEPDPLRAEADADVIDLSARRQRSLARRAS